MTDPPERGERVKIRWPGGPHDFEVRLDRIDPVNAPGWEGWVVVHGLCVSPEGREHRVMRSFFVQPVDGGYALLPKIER